VECDVEIWSSTACVRKNWKIKLEINSTKDILDDTYQKDAKNIIYSGGRYLSYLQIPVI
jgi:hypothetical protein